MAQESYEFIRVGKKMADESVRRPRLHTDMAETRFGVVHPLKLGLRFADDLRSLGPSGLCPIHLAQQGYASVMTESH